MNRIIERIKGFDIKRMFKMIKVICDRSGKPFIHIFLDIFRCWIKFGSGYMDYYLFYFETLPDDVKATYINVAVNKDYIRHCNNPKYYYVLNDKVTFLETYKKFIKREFLDLRKCSYKKYLDFYKTHKEFMVKPVDGLCGYGVELIVTKDHNPKDLYEQLKRNGQFLIEERIKQNKEINKIYKDSINTIRIVTLNKDNKVSIMFSAMRIGNNGKVVDNFNNGGLMAVIDDDGVIRKPVLDKDNKVYFDHPSTGTPIVGFKIPRYEKIIELCKELALVTPELGLCGWDIAVTSNGLDVVEGNHIPGYDIYQSREQLAPSIEGIKQRFDDAIYPEKKNQKIFAKGYNIFKFMWVFFFGVAIDYILGLFNITTSFAFIFGLTYITLYRNIDKHIFSKIILTLCIIGFIVFIGDYIVINYYDINNMNNPGLLFALDYLPTTVLKTFFFDILITLIVGLLCLYFIFPLIDKFIEKMSLPVGSITTIIISVLDILFIVIVCLSYITSILLYKHFIR